MDSTASRASIANIIAACIVAAGLIGASLIIAHQPAASVTSMAPATSVTPITPAAAMPTPPITQASAQKQFHDQVMSAPSLALFQYNGTTYKLVDIKVDQVIYASKDDQFSFGYDYVWRPAMPSGGPKSDAATLSNDGYGHYSGPVVLSPIDGGTGQNAVVTLR